MQCHEFDYYRTPKNKIFIDLVRICDSFDVATDYLGRSYFCVSMDEK